jgi:ABC-type branched-subunit amino acid transport system substrate-binding protein
MMFSDVMDEAMSIVQADESVTVAASSSTRQLKRRRRYVNREAAHFSLQHNYFDDDCM